MSQERILPAPIGGHVDLFDDASSLGFADNQETDVARRLGRGIRSRSSSGGSYRSIRRLSSTMKKEGTDTERGFMPSPGLFERGPQTPDYQQQSREEQREASEVMLPPEAHRIRKWHVEREAVVAQACDHLGVGSGGSEFFEQPRMVGLTGPCGSGKSTVASMVIARADVRKFFHKGILWLPVGKGAKDNLSELILHLARLVYEVVMQKACRPPRISGVGVEPEDGAAYIHEVVHESNLRFLVVADNVWEPEVLKELKWVGVWVLFTTRHEHLSHEATVRLDAMLEQEAELVLRRAADLEDTTPLPAAAYELMRRCEFSAMYLAFAGRWGVVRGRSDEEAWRAALDHIEEARKAGEGEEPLPWCDAMLRAGPDELASNTPQNKELYLSLALLPKGLAFRTNVATVLLYGDDGSAETQEAVGKVLATLERLSILTLELGGKYRVHEVHADFVWDHCLANHAETRDRALLRWKEYISTVKALNTYSSVWLMKIWDVVAAIEGNGVIARPYDEALEAIDASSAKLPKALRRAARFHWRRKDRLEAYTKQYQVRLIEASQIDSSSVAVANILYVLGMCIYKSGRRRDAEKIFQRALVIFEEKLGPDHLEVAHTLYELGRCFYTTGRTDDAEQYLLRALAIEEEKLGTHHLDVASTRYHLGVCLYHAGRREEAKNPLRTALAIWEEHPEGDRLNIAHALHAIGLCALKTGEIEEAEHLFRRCLDIREDLVGPDHADVASTLHYLAASALKAGREKDAENLYRRALAIREEALGPDHPDLARTLHNLGVCVNKVGAKEEAKALLARALSIKEESLGTSHPSAAKTRDALNPSTPAVRNVKKFAGPVLAAGGLLAAMLLLRSGRKIRP